MSNGPRRPIEVGTFISGSEVFRERSTIEMIETLLAPVHRGIATQWLTGFSRIYEQGDPESIFELDRQARAAFLSGEVRQRVETLIRYGGRRIAFHRPQLLLGLQLVQRVCDDQRPDTPEARAVALGRLGEALIRISDFLNYGPPQIPDWHEGAAMLLPSYADSNPPGLLLSIRRTFGMLSDPLWASDARLLTATARFERSIGLTPRAYMLVILGLVTRARLRTTQKLDPALRLDRVFATARDAAAIQRAVEGLSIPYADLPRVVGGSKAILEERPAEPFRSKPLIALGSNRFWVTDLSFLTDRMLSGVFWTLMDLSELEGNQLSAAWGELFERYMHRLLAPVLGSSYVVRPLDANQSEITDAIVIERPWVTLIEYKSSILTDASKYGLKFQPLMLEIENKFLRRAQLARAAIRLLRDRRDLVGTGRRLIYPVIVSLDPAIASPLLPAAMNEVLRSSELPARNEAAFEHLSVLTADDAELIVRALANGKKLKNILRESKEADPEGGSTFHNYLVDLYKGAVPLGASADEFREPFDAAKAFWIDQGGNELFDSI